MNRIITIGREFGSGGRELARRLSEELGCAYYDQEILDEIARRTQLSETYVKSIVEHAPAMSFPIHVGRSFQSAVTPFMDQTARICREQAAIIRELAAASDSVIVGRCADYILRDSRPLRIFVYSDMESKIRRCRERGGDASSLSDRQLERMIKDIDSHRRKFYDFITGQSWGDRHFYDIMVNTTSMDIRTVAREIAAMVRNLPE